MQRPVNFNWLLVLLASWAIPVYWPLSYLFSLVFWVFPIIVLLPDFLAATDTATKRRRRALWYSAGWIVTLGIALDFGLGPRILTFTGDWYLYRVRDIPVEELLFYTLAPLAIILVYAWCDEHWLLAYNQTAVRDHVLAREPPLLKSSPPIVATALALIGLATTIKWVAHGRLALPTYATFLIVFAFIPAAATYRAVHAFVNWRAFGATTIYVIGTSLAYEVTLAIPLGWWGYREEATIGITIWRWSSEGHPFPLEAAAVWVAAPFSCVLTYEFAKAYLHHPSRNRRTKLTGSDSGRQARALTPRRTRSTE